MSDVKVRPTQLRSASKRNAYKSIIVCPVAPSTIFKYRFHEIQHAAGELAKEGYTRSASVTVKCTGSAVWQPYDDTNYARPVIGAVIYKTSVNGHSCVTSATSL